MLILKTHCGRAASRPTPGAQDAPAPPVVHIVDGDCESPQLAAVLAAEGLAARGYASVGAFLDADAGETPQCLMIDARLLERGDRAGVMTTLGARCPVVLMAEGADVRMVVVAMKTGAVDFVEKPLRDADVLGAVEGAIALDRSRRLDAARVEALRARHAELRYRERQVMALVTAGRMNKQIAFELGLSEVTVKVHRGAVMRKMGARSLAELVRMADALDVANSRSEAAA